MCSLCASGSGVNLHVAKKLIASCYSVLEKRTEWEQHTKKMKEVMEIIVLDYSYLNAKVIRIFKNCLLGLITKI